MAIKKSELYSSLWASCDELRGGMDASQYKDYVLVLLFVKYVSDKYAGMDYAPITIPPGASFKDMVALKGNSEIGDRINKHILAPLAEANGLASMPDFNDATKLGDGKEMVQRLTNLIAIFENPALDFSKNRADGDDILGDAYEYLMRHFATESGKSKGQFYTPAEVSRVMAKIIGFQDRPATTSTTVYDPTCGSGSLLLKVADEAHLPITPYGQEKDSATAGLARMNMILHDRATAEIKTGNTLANPLFKDGDTLKQFDYVVANPPFSDKSWSNGVNLENDPHARFKSFGIPPAKQGDYAYLLHIVRSLKSTGKGACILPHGVLFRGNAEAVIRRKLIERGYIKGIIGLPANLFYGTGIPACIIVIDKEHAHSRQGIFMIDASRGFIKDGPKNRLRDQDIHKIVDNFTRQSEVPRYSRLVPTSEISDAKNDFNLNLPRYIDTTEPEDLQDINAHLRGGIPNRDIDALDRYWQVIPGLRATLFSPSKYEGYSDLAVTDVKAAIFGHPEFVNFKASVEKLFGKWKSANAPKLKSFGQGGHPKQLITDLAEDLLATLAQAPLLDHYDIYQHLMDYWTATMQDDCYLIAFDGWIEAAKPKLIVDDKAKKTKEKPDLIVGRRKFKTELVPPTLIIGQYFSEEQATIDKLEAELAGIRQQMEEMAEEHGGEEGLLEAARNGKDKLSSAAALARIKEIEGEPESDEELQLLNSYHSFALKVDALNSSLKSAHEILMERVLDQYEQLSEGEIKSLVIDGQWHQALDLELQAELERVQHNLTNRISELMERYANTLEELNQQVDHFASIVDNHLRRMGAVCQ